MEKKQTAIFFGVDNDKRKNNKEFSNFVYSLCKFCVSEKLNDSYDPSSFIRHKDLFVTDVRQSIFNCIVRYDTLVFLVDEMPMKVVDKVIRMYNPNVWFELGISAPQTNKKIVLISLYEEMPFYARTVQPVVICKEIIDEFFMRNLNRFQDYDYDKMVDFIREFYNDSSQDDLHKSFKSLVYALEQHWRLEGNPFQGDVDYTEISILLDKLGYGKVSELFEKFGEQTAAKFITGEENAFRELSREVLTTEKVLRTTRFANQSIVTNEDDDNKIKESRDDFMKALYKVSSKGTESHRIICNNSEKKWKDIYKYLFNCSDNTHISIASCNERVIYHEMVIIDDRIVFLHFYLTGDYERTSEVQRINSTLKITSQEVASEFIKIYNSTEKNDKVIFVRFNTEKVSTVSYDEKEEVIMRLFIESVNAKISSVSNICLIRDDLKNMLVGMCIIKDDIDKLEEFENRYNKKVKFNIDDEFRIEINNRIKKLKENSNAEQ